MKILTAQQLREADEHTINNEPVSSIDLMERAAAKCVAWIVQHIEKGTQVNVYCGPGNNGGDGLAIARILIEKEYSVHVSVVASSKYSPDFTINEQRLKSMTPAEVRYISDPSQIEPPARDSVVIDALFGSGLNKIAEGIYADVIYAINRSGARVISIDLPSGLFADDNSTNKGEGVIRAWRTLTFQTPKLAFMFPGGGSYVGEFVVLDIGLSRDYLAQAGAKDHFITKHDVAMLLRPRAKFSHKGSFGHALIIGGSYGKMGAAALAAEACIRSGAGLVTVHIPQCGYQVIQSAVPEAMASVDNGEHFITSMPRSGTFSALGIGPGLGTNDRTKNMMKLLVQDTRVPMLIDADALNILGENKTWISFLKGGTILTPHSKEFERIAGGWMNDEERHQLHRNFAVKHNVYVVLKGAHTAVACPDGNVYFNSTGNTGMATGGSGDVLTGIITGLVAQGYNPRDASVLGVYLHGLAGDLAAAQGSEESLAAGDIAKELGQAFKYLRSA